MINRSIIKYTTYLLIFLLLISPFTAVRADKDTPYITDPITGIQYADHPPPELLKGKSEQDQRRLLEWWAKEADGNLKSQISEYYVCERELKKAKEELAVAEAGIDKKSEEYKKARIALNRKIVGLIYQMGLSTAVIMTDAAVDLYLAGKDFKESIRGSSKHKERRISEAQEKTAQDKTNIASKREQYIKSLEESFNESARSARATETRTGEIIRTAPPPVRPGPPPTKYKNAPYQDVVNATGPVQEPWLSRYQGRLPENAKPARLGRPMVLDPAKGSYLYIVQESGNVVYAPKFDVVDGVYREVKHTDLTMGVPARIGGEIQWDGAAGVWRMNNDSGRYSAVMDPNRGFIPTRTTDNLEAAVELVRRSGTDAQIVSNYIVFR